MNYSITAFGKIITVFGITTSVMVLPPAVPAKNPKMIQRSSGGMSLTPSSPAQPLIRQGDYHRAHGDIDKALALYTQAIKFDPKAAGAFIGRAQVWEEFGKMDKALADFTTACKSGPPFNLTAARYRGDLYQSLHRFQEAINDYSVVLSVAPTDGLFLNRASCYLKMNNPAMAVKDFDKAISMGGNRSSTYEKRGDAYLALNQNAKALADYNLTLKLDPDGSNSKDSHEHLHKSKAEIYKRMGKLDLAKKETAAAKAGRNANIDLAPFASDSMK